MDIVKILEKRIEELEKRVANLEKIVLRPKDEHDIWMDQLYEKARELVIKNNKATPIFLQRKLYIDFQRANKLLSELEKNGVVGPETVEGPRQVLAKK